MKTFVRVWLSISLIALGFGIGLLVLAAASGTNWKDVPTISMNESYEGVEKLDIDVVYGFVNIVKGDNFSISTENYVEGGIKSYVTDDGTWIIKEDNDDFFNIFGWRMPVRKVFHWWNDEFSPKITITIPEGFHADDFSLKVESGEVKAEEISTETGSFKVGAGYLEVQHLLVNEKSQYNTGAGNMVLKDAKVKDINVDCGAGNIDIEGKVTGDNDMKTGIGRISLNLEGDKDDYSYHISSGIGNVVLDGRSYHSINNKEIDNDNADNYLDLDCGIGNITVDFD